ncbi:uncharacterized protein BDW47DRAFT_122633 [Aspergillus candidus]|uniref:Uncharacterized protein n=1 Tax=Aspergillus candidus TaxID=41067 RepID=A0A2I2FLU0_ASPCN|nr:hypothetical protein BDW47DRAFT_122633 [Aspergillus candidus]PLB41591.1 hypothetical protein BDW47DRAFT_122633 [Aspergillus candidus]
MQFTNIILALMATTVAVAAPAAGENTLARRVDCPNGWSVCGECNGTSCKVAGTDRVCEEGSCTSQSGAGDGTICGNPDPFAVKMICPGKSG